MATKRNILYEHRGALHAINYVLHLAKEMKIEEKFIETVEEVRDHYTDLIKEVACESDTENDSK